MGPEGPDKVRRSGWGQIMKDSEGVNHGALENGLHCSRCPDNKLKGGWQEALEGEGPRRRGCSIRGGAVKQLKPLALQPGRWGTAVRREREGGRKDTPKKLTRHGF